MSIEPTPEPTPTPTPEPTPASAAGSGAAPIHRILLEALAKEDSGATALKHLLARAPLSADQQAMLELLVSLEEKGRDSEAVPPATGASRTDVAALQELADLREVNDTCAGAVGACSVCWGGDARCPVCAGRGRAGFAMPDLALFKELVAPAIRRVRELRRVNEWKGVSRVDRDGPHWQR